MSPKAILVASILLAAALRFADLGRRPMHTDEGVHADKFGTLLEGGGYAYDPAEFHGPSLYYLTLPAAWLRGQWRYADLDEVTLRAVPAALGVGLVAAHLGAAPFLGATAAAVAALLTALSPAMVFYNRDYIHETPLVLFGFVLLLAVGHYLRRPGPLRALAAGAAAGLMLATKETAPIMLGCLLAGLAALWLGERRREPAPARLASIVRGRDAALAVAAALLVAALFFSSFLSHPRGLVDALRSYGLYLDRAQATSWHHHPWDFYLRLLAYVPAQGTPVWTEGLILLLAVFGGAAGWRAGGVPGGDARAVRFLSVYTLSMLVVYSAIPYKTPWCLLGFLHGLILLAGVGAVFVVHALRTRATRLAVVILVVGGTAQLGWQAWSASIRLPADPRNPYVYAQTGTDVFTVTRRLDDLARVSPAGRAIPIQIISRENLWPLPWYLRAFSGVAWWTGVSEASPSAPVVIITPDMEPALVHKLYDLPPPGERELYVPLFERRVELRPGVELRGYLTAALWNELRSGAAAAPAPR